MSALPPSLPPDGNEAESLAQLAAQIVDLTALLKRENDGRLSPAEAALIPEVAPKPSRKKRPLAEIEAKVEFNGHEFDLTFNVYGRVHRAYPGDSGGPGERRVSPPEPAHVEVDAITISNGHYEVELDAALPEEMINALAATAYEELGE